jgi:predicted SAM-dependent methyltransferase
MKQLLQKVMPRGLYLSLRKNLAWELRAYFLHLLGLVRSRPLRSRNNLKIHFGCGSKIKDGWINIDLNRKADLTLDLREPLPFSDGSCSIVYSQHFLEHLDYPEPLMSFLKESYRVLQCHGVFSLGVPDTEWPILEYAGMRNEGYFQTAKKKWHPEWCITRMEHINQHFREYGKHRFAYDFETLERVLNKAGFIEVKRREFDSELDSEDRRLGTLYVEGKKPIKYHDS